MKNQIIGCLLGKCSLRTVLIAPFMTLLVGTVGLTEYLSFRTGQRAVHELAAQLHHEIAARIQQRLESYLKIPHLINQLNYDSIESGELDPNDFPRLERHFWKQLRQFESVMTVTYASEQGEGAGVDRSTLRDALAAGVCSRSTGYALEVYALDERGNHAAHIGTFPKYDPRSRVWYQTAVKQTHAAWTPVYIWINGDIGIDAAAPVYTQQNALMGVLSVSLTLSEMNTFLQHLTIGKTGQAFILERSGLLVASSTGEKPFRREREQTRRVSALHSDNPVIRLATKGLLANFADLRNITEASSIDFYHAGKRQLAHVTPYRDQYGLDWLIVVVIPEADFMANIHANTYRTAVLVLMTLLIAIGLGIAITQCITHPILQLNQAAKALARGDWTPQVTPARIDELGELAMSFNAMSRQLQEAFATLQSSEQRHRALFEDSPVSLWEEDASAIKHAIDRLRSNGVSDLHAYIEAHPDVLTDWLHAIKVLRVNQATIKLFHASNQEELIRRFAAIFTEQALETFREEMIALSQGKMTYESEVTQQTLFGDALWLNVRVTIAPGYEETWSKRFISIYDITERKRAEDALKESEKKFRELTELLPQAIFEIDIHGRFLYANQQGFSITGYTEADIEHGVSAFQLLIPDDRERAAENILKILNNTASNAYEYTILKKDGNTFPGLIYTAPIIRNQHPVGLRGIIIDLTDFKRLEAQLVQSQKMEAIGHLAGGIAHDFNTLLGIILGYGEMMRDDLFEETVLRENLEEIIAAGTRAKVLIKQLLDFARPNQHDRHPLRLADVLTETLRLLQSTVPTVMIQERIDAASSVVLANASQMMQVIMNLGVNAGHAIGTHDGKIDIVLEDVEVTAADAEIHAVSAGTYVRLTVSDTGCGMNPQMLEHIFEPFFTTKEVGKGSGLGLSVVHGIVKSHGGFITVQSEPGAGSRFQVYVPKMNA